MVFAPRKFSIFFSRMMLRQHFVWHIAGTPTDRAALVWPGEGGAVRPQENPKTNGREGVCARVSASPSGARKYRARAPLLASR